MATGFRPIRSKGWFTILRLYSPLESFFTKKWRPSEIEAGEVMTVTRDDECRVSKEEQVYECD